MRLLHMPSLLGLIATACMASPDADNDIWLYNVSYYDSSRWQSICGLDSSGAPIQAIAAAGRWDTHQGYPGAGGKIADATQFTLACQGVGAVAKCIDMGYKPWL